jgi:hypothetical protein
MVPLWDYWQAQVGGREQAGESNRRLQMRLEREFLSTRKLREWADVHAQLREAVESMHWKENETPATHEQVPVRVAARDCWATWAPRRRGRRLYAGTHTDALHDPPVLLAHQEAAGAGADGGGDGRRRPAGRADRWRGSSRPRS